MVKTAILIIVPDFKSEDDVTNWEIDLKWTEQCYDIYPYYKNNFTTRQRWALGFVVWNKLIKFLKNNDITTYFIRTDYRLETEYEINDNIISVKFDKSFGNIIYKTITAFKILINDNFDFFVRGNLNSIIDINQLNIFLNFIPKKGIFTSPLCEGSSYPFGYFMLMSRDVINFIITNNFDNKWFLEDTSDDYELTNVILKNFKFTNIPGCDKHYQNQSKRNFIQNKCAIKFDDTAKGCNSSEIINKINNSPDLIFLYRIKIVSDNNYVEVYKSLIKHIWNKEVKHQYKDIKIYNEFNALVPHLEYERDEQLLVARYIKSDDIVLELGARYGSVSCIINKILNNKKNQVSVEPDSTVWNILEKNRALNGCSFTIHKGIISKNNYEIKLNGYGSTIDLNNNLTNLKSIKTNNISLENLQHKLNIKFNVLVADCEGFLEIFLDENTFLYEQLNTIIFECDRSDVCNYNKIKSNLLDNGFKLIENGFQCVYSKIL